MGSLAKIGTKILKPYKKFKFSTRSANRMKNVIKTSKKLRKAVKKVFTNKAVKTILSKKGLTALTVGTGIGLSAHLITKYINENSGCFLYENDKELCKVRQLSCCNKTTLKEGLSFCNQKLDTAPVNACDSYDDDDKKNDDNFKPDDVDEDELEDDDEEENDEEKKIVDDYKLDAKDSDKKKVLNSCCLLCDCIYHNCGPYQEMKCHDPTVAEALSYYSKIAGETVLNTVSNTLPFLKQIIYGLIALFVFVVYFKILF